MNENIKLNSINSNETQIYELIQKHINENNLNSILTSTIYNQIIYATNILNGLSNFKTNQSGMKKLFDLKNFVEQHRKKKLNNNNNDNNNNDNNNNSNNDNDNNDNNDNINNNNNEENINNRSYIMDCIQKKSYNNILFENLKISENEKDNNEKLNNSYY